MADTPTPEAIAVKFSEAIEFLRRRLAIGSDEWLRILAEEGEVSSAIADDTARSVIDSLIQEVADAIDAGDTLATFQDRYTEIVQARGWAYKGNAGWHSELIWRLWTNQAFSAGKWEQAQRVEAERPGTYYGRLVTVGDHDVRHTHHQMHGIVRPIGDAYWKTHWPPNGFNCRCTVQILTARSLARYGYTVTPDNDPRLKVPPDKGFGFNSGLAGTRAAMARRDVPAI